MLIANFVGIVGVILFGVRGLQPIQGKYKPCQDFFYNIWFEK